MSATSTDTAVFAPQEDSLLKSGFLSSSIQNLSPSRNSNSQISRSYKQARDLFLTRRLPEACSTIESLLILPTVTEDDPIDEDQPKLAPIARASRSQRIKVWSLYLTMLNSIHELGPEQGKAQFGRTEWRRLTSKAWDGSIWEEVVRNGYRGIEGNVDGDVITNLYDSITMPQVEVADTRNHRATLLLAQSPSQKINQQRLESYLSTSTQPNLDISRHFGSQTIANGSPRSKKDRHGTDTPRDLAARVKILELYTLHVLPRNEEWDYARDFVKMSEILDDDTREAFLQTLDELQAPRIQSKPNGEISKPDDCRETLQHIEPREVDDPEPSSQETNNDDGETTPKAQRPQVHQRNYSEHDYGIDIPKPSSDSSRRLPSSSFKPPSNSSRSQTISSAQNKKPPSPSPSSLFIRSTTLLINFQTLILNMTYSLSKNPMALVRFVLFVLGLVVALSRRDVKVRIAKGWEKVRQTVGMGVKVTYI